MSKEIDQTAARLQQEIPAAEFRIDEALIAVSALTASVVTARRDTAGVSPTRGHTTIKRLVQAQMSLVEVSGSILRVHGELVDIGRETAGYDLHECPKTAGSNVVPITAAA